MFSASSSLHFLNIIHCFKVFLLFLNLSLPIVQSLTCNITNFDDAESASNIAYEGDGKPTNGSIELNKVSYYFRVGRAMYGQPLHLWDSSTNVLTDFTTHFTFTIDRVNDTTYGDGFAFYMAPPGYQIPPNSAGGTFGLCNATTNSNLPQNHVFAVEFDTFVGSTDPPMQHVGIDDNSLTSVACAKFDIEKNTGNPCHAIINYDASTKTLTVSWSFNGSRSTSNGNSMPNSSSLSCNKQKQM